MRKIMLFVIVLVLFVMVSSVSAADPVLVEDKLTHVRGLQEDRATGQGFTLDQDRFNSLKLFIIKVGEDDKDDNVVMTIGIPDWEHTMFGEFRFDGDPLKVIKIPICEIAEALETQEKIEKGDEEGIWFEIPVDMEITPGKEYAFTLHLEQEKGFVLYGLAHSVARNYPEMRLIEKSSDGGNLFRVRTTWWNLLFKFY